MTIPVHHRRTFARAFRRLALPGMLLACLLASIPAAAGGLIDINTANAEELAAAMTGVGIKKAKAIVAYRDENGPFASIDDLVQVRGIGAATVDSNRDRVSVTNPDPDPGAPAPKSG